MKRIVRKECETISIDNIDVRNDPIAVFYSTGNFLGYVICLDPLIGGFIRIISVNGGQLYGERGERSISLLIEKNMELEFYTL